MNSEVLLGWLTELEAIAARGSGLADALASLTGEPQPELAHWHVFAALVAMPLRPKAIAEPRIDAR
jgi:hypothetical protein